MYETLLTSRFFGQNNLSAGFSVSFQFISHNSLDLHLQRTLFLPSWMDVSDPRELSSSSLLPSWQLRWMKPWTSTTIPFSPLSLFHNNAYFFYSRRCLSPNGAHPCSSVKNLFKWLQSSEIILTGPTSWIWHSVQITCLFPHTPILNHLFLCSPCLTLPGQKPSVAQTTLYSLSIC